MIVPRVEGILFIFDSSRREEVLIRWRLKSSVGRCIAALKEPIVSTTAVRHGWRVTGWTNFHPNPNPNRNYRIAHTVETDFIVGYKSTMRFWLVLIFVELSAYISSPLCAHRSSLLFWFLQDVSKNPTTLSTKYGEIYYNYLCRGLQFGCCFYLLGQCECAGTSPLFVTLYNCSAPYLLDPSTNHQ